MPNSQNKGLDAQTAKALVALCAGVLPVWSRHLASSRSQSEVAVTEMLQAFSDIGPHINMAERQSEQITQALSQGDGSVVGLAQACEAALQPVLRDPNVPASTSQAVQRVLDMVNAAVSALENITKPFNHETQMVAAQVERMYVGFQYQDRISQMMALLEGDIARLRGAIEGQGKDLPDLDAWLSQLESKYAMAEQHHSHQEDSTSAAGGADNETTFF